MYLPGNDLFDYNAAQKFGCGFLLSFEATPIATEELIHVALAQFAPFSRQPFDDSEQGGGLGGMEGLALTQHHTQKYREFM